MPVCRNSRAATPPSGCGGEPLLAGDPHIRFSNPAMWYEAHTQMPGSELYGHCPAVAANSTGNWPTPR